MKLSAFCIFEYSMTPWSLLSSKTVRPTGECRHDLGYCCLPWTALESSSRRAGERNLLCVVAHGCHSNRLIGWLSLMIRFLLSLSPLCRQTLTTGVVLPPAPNVCIRTLRTSLSCIEVGGSGVVCVSCHLHACFRFNYHHWSTFGSLMPLTSLRLSWEGLVWICGLIGINWVLSRLSCLRPQPR